MATSPRAEKANGRRRSILDLAPLELECLKVLWPMGQGTVRQIRDELAPVRPRAYTTIMTIMDRLAQKGAVARQKVGRAYLYRPNFTAEEARTRAIEQLVRHFFAGSPEALLAHLTGGKAAGAVLAAPAPAREQAAEKEGAAESAPATRLDETLL